MRRKDNVLASGAAGGKFVPRLEYLIELAGGDNHFIAEIIQMFIQEAPDAVRQSFQHLENDEMQRLLVTVHKLKSSVQVVGGQHLAVLISEIEQQAKQAPASSDDIQRMLGELEKGISQIVNWLNGELPQFAIKDAA